MTQHRAEQNSARARLLLGGEHTIADLPLPEFHQAVAQLDGQGIELIRQTLIAAKARAQRELDQATKNWQERGEGLPDWCSVRYKSITVLDRKLERLLLVRRERSVSVSGDVYSIPSLSFFEKSVGQYAYEELVAIKRHLDAHLEIRGRGQKIQIVQKYLQVKAREVREQRQKEDRERQEKFERMFMRKTYDLLGEAVYYALINETKKVAEDPDASAFAISPPALSPSPLASVLVELEAQVSEQAGVLEEIQGLESQATRLEEQASSIRVRLEELQTANPEAKQAAELLTKIRVLVDE